MTRHGQDGFTLIELLLAMTFFSFIMMFIVIGFIQVNRSYVRGQTVNEVQNSAREVIEILSSIIRSADGSSVEVYDDVSGPLRLCAGSVRVGWNMAVDSSSGTFTTDTYGDVGRDYSIAVSPWNAELCPDPIDLHSGGLEDTISLVSDHVIIQYLDIDRIGPTNSFKIVVVISTDALLNPDDFSEFGANATCEIRRGDQFCDVARIETVVTARN